MRQHIVCNSDLKEGKMNCRKCGKKIKELWKGWELCDCGHRHHVESGWHDKIEATSPPFLNK